MGMWVLTTCIQRILLPIILFASILFRPCLFSGLYFILLIILPYIPLANPKTLKSTTGYYLKLLMFTSFLTSFAQILFQVVLLSFPPYGSFIERCSELDILLRHVGFVTLTSIKVIEALVWVTPELIMVFGSIIVYVVIGKLVQRQIEKHTNATDSEEINVVTGIDNNEQSRNAASSGSNEKMQLLYSAGRFLSLISLLIAASIKPSLIGGIYFLIFIGAGTWWSCGRNLGKNYAIVLKCVQFIAIIDMHLMYLYQFPYIQSFVPEDSLIIRLLGLDAFITVKCSEDDDPRHFNYHAKETVDYLNPIVNYIMFFVCVQVSSILMEAEDERSDYILNSNIQPSFSNVQPVETQPLLRGVTASYAGGSRRSTTSKVSGDGGSGAGDNIPMQQIGSDKEVSGSSSLIETVFYAVCSISLVIVRSSYLATNIIMMTWSITYHSWLTLVLLMWANILWLFPNHRRSMLNSSPILVIYATFLLLSQYIFTLDLTESELPSQISGINLAQIGFYRPTELRFKPLIIKSLYTTMFWITMRQFMKERLEAQQSSAIQDIVSPLQISMGAAMTTQVEELPSNKYVKLFGTIAKTLLTKYWIWVVAFILFLSGITGTRMTGFRIIYMALFLVFIFLFQASWRIWRTFMFTFWLAVIIYSMTILLIIYTYQFDNFPEYWEKYLFIPEDLQRDIGLERYVTTDLFVRLLTPTFFVIICVIQLHYFHKDFLLMTKIRTITVEDANELPEESNISTHSKTSKLNDDVSDVRTTQGKSIFGSWISWKRRINYLVDFIWNFLEMHMTKVVMLTTIIVATYDVAAIHFILIIMAVMSLPLGNRVIFGCRITVSAIISIMFLLRMIYQIDYIPQEMWNVNCTEDHQNETLFSNLTTVTPLEDKELSSDSENVAVWLGFQKLKADESLFHLLRWYIIYILISTFGTVVDFRQIYTRQKLNLPLKKPSVMFPDVTRRDADKDTLYCIKYLLNYGFYKFGVECSLIMTAVVVCFRTDFYAVLYGFWLLLLCVINRQRLENIWPLYITFIIIIIPVQYFCVIGIPPIFCIGFPWQESDTLQRTQDWFYLMDSVNPPPASKIILDFILLLCVIRQKLVFKIESQFDKQNLQYNGGSNRNIIKDADIIDFVNPVPDFLTVIHNWLDLYKRGVFVGFIWVALAIIFLTGTNRVNVFSIGYLIGTFIFLWQGSDLFLRPLIKILKIWQKLIIYNVLVILTKALLQIPGCIFIKITESYSCWAIEMFGIGCLRYFVSRVNLSEESEQCSHSDESAINLHWDLLCFACLIFQKRIFQSYYFFHVVDETKAMTILASRGAELIEELRKKHVKEQEEREKMVLENIKKKMDRIKENQRKIQGPNYKDPENHYVDRIFRDRPLYRRRIPKTNREAIRSGDYYMFDNIEDRDDLDTYEEQSDDSDNKLKGDDLTLGEEKKPLVEPSTSSAPQYQYDKRKKKRDDDDDDDGDKDDGSSVISQDIFQDDAEMGEEEPKTWSQKLNVLILILWTFIKSALLSITLFLNKFSKNYRFVSKVLIKEKKLLKEKTTFRVGIRRGSAQVWQPLPSSFDILQKVRNDIDNEIKGSKPKLPDINQPSTSTAQSSYTMPQVSSEQEMSSADQPVIVRLALAIWFVILSNSEIVCYFMVFLNQIKSASLISLPLPMMVFLWGTLTIPRPSKTFWVTMIAYIEVIVIIKCMFQFKFLPWNEFDVNTNPFFPPRILGIERKADYANYDLFLLLVVFFHRSMLKSLGLWKTGYAPIPHFGGPLFHPDNTPISMTKTKVPSQDNQSTFQPDDSETKLELDNIYVTPGGLALSAKTGTSSEEAASHVDSSKKELNEQLENENQMDLVLVNTENREPYDYFPNVIGLSVKKHLSPVQKFIKCLYDPSLRVAADVYAYMFLCDFFNFLVIIFGFSAFGTQQGDGGVQTYLKENKVPMPFLLMLILQFMLILIDRALYLRKYILGKIIFQFVTIIGVHIWMFFVLPHITERQFNSRLPPQMWYMVKCFYLLLSAYQIRSGYPTRILGNFLCKGYNYINFGLFKAFMLIPFLFELRTIMDWMWTDTSMTIFDWLKMEDIFANIFQLKCNRHNENEFPQARGIKKNEVVKYFMGGTALFIIIGIIWFPLVLFALGKTVGVPNIPVEVTMEVRIGPYQSIYSMSAQANQIIHFNQKKWAAIQALYLNNKDKLANTFLTNYESEDIAEVVLSGNSTNIWSISPPDIDRLIEELNSTHTVTVRAKYHVKRDILSKDNARSDLDYDLSYDLQPFDPDNNATIHPSRAALIQMLQGANDVKPVLLPFLLPKFLKVTSLGDVGPVPQLLKPVPTSSDQILRNITVKLSRSVPNASISGQMWWEIKENCSGYNYDTFISQLPDNNCNLIQIYMFNEKKFPDTLSLISGGGIISLYTTLVFFASRFVRGFFSDLYSKIMFEDLPNVDRIMQLCLDIYLVRESRELTLEEDLFAKLVFLYRSPETLIKWTRPPHELEGDESERQPSIGN